jgi:putative NADH-flavin reductase
MIPMRLALVGAHGKTGRLVADIAAKLGHHVQPLEGDALELSALERAIHGSHAVICTLGPVKDSPADLCSRATSKVIEAMAHEHVGRLVMVTGAMCGPPENLGRFYRTLIRIPPLARALEDRRRQEALVRASSLDWTLVRPPRLTDEDRRGDPQVLTATKIGALDHASRRHLALTLVRAATTDAWPRQGVYVRS